MLLDVMRMRIFVTRIIVWWMMKDKIYDKMIYCKMNDDKKYCVVKIFMMRHMMNDKMNDYDLIVYWNKFLTKTLVDKDRWMMIEIYWRWMIKIFHKIYWRWMIMIFHKIYLCIVYWNKFLIVDPSGNLWSMNDHDLLRDVWWLRFIKDERLWLRFIEGEWLWFSQDLFVHWNKFLTVDPGVTCGRWMNDHDLLRDEWLRLRFIEGEWLRFPQDLL
jgi:hypothetical protein